MKYLIQKLLFVVFYFLLGSSVSAQVAYARSEYEIKAAYLYNFIKFVTWENVEPGSKNPIDICVFGDDPFQAVISPLKKLKAQGRTIQIAYPKALEAIANCEVLYIAASEGKLVPALIKEAKGHDILTVSDIKDFAKLGGIVGFVTVGNVIRFQINLASAKNSKIQVSSKLLELALEVIQEEVQSD